MKVFKFYSEGDHYAYAAETEEKAREAFAEEMGTVIDSTEEIPESEWDKRFIKIYEDNNISGKSFKTSIRDSIHGTEAQMVFTSDSGLF